MEYFSKKCLRIIEIVVPLRQSYNNFGKNSSKMVEKKHLSKAIGQYFANLLAAISGKNPYCQEMERMRQVNEKNAKDVVELNKLYYCCVQKMDDYTKQIKALQMLVENLREHIAKKEELIELANHDYQKRIREMNENHRRQIDMYVTEVSNLRKCLNTDSQD